MISFSGIYWVTLMDTYGAAGFALLFVVFFEVIGISWGFGELLDEGFGIIRPPIEFPERISYSQGF